MSNLYGLTYGDQDRAKGLSERRASYIFEGSGTVNSSGSVTFRLVEANTGKQGLYFPPSTYARVIMRALVTDTSTTSALDGTACTVVTAAGGDPTVSGGVVTFDTDVLITATANTTADCVEFVVSETSGSHTVYIRMIVDVIYYRPNATGTNKLRVGSTAGALTAEE